MSEAPAARTSTHPVPAPAPAPERPMVVNCAEYAQGRRVCEVELDKVSDVLADESRDRFVWIGLHEPSEELLRKVQEEFGLHDLAIEDAHRAHQRPKIEEYGNDLFIVVRTVHAEGDEVAFGETHIFVGASYVVTVRHGSSRSYAEVRQRCECTPHLLGNGPGFVLYSLLDFIVDQYFSAAEVYEERLGALERDIFAGEATRDVTERIYQLKVELLHFKRAVSPLIEMCNRLMRFDQALIPEATKPYFRDVHDHVIRVNEALDNLRELVTGALEANLALVGLSQSEVAKKLAGWAAILAVPTMIVGVYGMNFEFMPELQWRFGYPVVMGGIITICSVLYWRFRRARWL